MGGSGMRFHVFAGMSLVLSGVWMSANAAPVDLLCKADGAEAHLSIDVDAAKVIWADRTFDATVTDTEIRWSGVVPMGITNDGPTLYGTFDRDSGTLVLNYDAGSDPATGVHWSVSHTTWACTKAQKIL